jgi:hypothetical protein
LITNCSARLERNLGCLSGRLCFDLIGVDLRAEVLGVELVLELGYFLRGKTGSFTLSGY